MSALDNATTIKAYREQVFPKNSRVRLIEWETFGYNDNDHNLVPKGTLGTTTGVVNVDGTVFVEWDNGEKLGAMLTDIIELVD